MKTGSVTRLWRQITGTAGCTDCGRQSAHRSSTRLAQGTGGTYTIIDASGAGTGMLEGTIGISINASGNVAGTYLDSNMAAHGFIDVGGTITEINAPGAGTGSSQGTFALSIDAAGNVAGMYADTSNAYHGFILPAGGSITEFDPPGAGTGGHRGTIPLSISAGVIAGSYVTGSPSTTSVYHGFMRATDGTITSFDPPGAGTSDTSGTQSAAINSAGVITGTYLDNNFERHGYLRSANGTFTNPIDVPGASDIGTVPASIDAAGDITGFYADSNGLYHGFVRSAGGTITTIDAPGATTTPASGNGVGSIAGTLASSINTTGVIAGFYTDSNGAVHGFVRAANGAFTDPLDAPNAGTAPLEGTTGFGINDSGLITGTYADTNEALHGFVLTPTSVSQAATPTFDPAAGTYTSAQMVAISDTTPDSTIYYTTDGTTPTTDSPVYSGPVTVNSTETIEAIAAASGFSNSAVASAAYTINLAADYQVSVNPSTLTIVAGQSGTATFTVTPLNGFDSPVSFACSGLPSEAVCGFNPTSVTPTDGNPATSTLTVTTTAAGAALRGSKPSSVRPIYALLFPGLAMVLGIAGRRRRALRGLQVLSVVVLLGLASELTSCSSTSAKNPGTPVGTTTASVTASTSGSGGTSHTATLTIIITQ
ncbi:MAG: chitobiase/beta-hexosaminidase C-terminal domain-containing protein [Terriglobales bacterium]